MTSKRQFPSADAVDEKPQAIRHTGTPILNAMQVASIRSTMERGQSKGSIIQRIRAAALNKVNALIADTERDEKELGLVVSTAHNLATKPAPK